MMEVLAGQSVGTNSTSLSNSTEPSSDKYIESNKNISPDSLYVNVLRHSDGVSNTVETMDGHSVENKVNHSPTSAIAVHHLSNGKLVGPPHGTCTGSSNRVSVGPHVGISDGTERDVVDNSNVDDGILVGQSDGTCCQLRY